MTFIAVFLVRCTSILFQVLDPSEKLDEVGPAIEPTVGDNRANLLRVADVLERVGVEEHQISELTGFDCPQDSVRPKRAQD